MRTAIAPACAIPIFAVLALLSADGVEAGEAARGERVFQYCYACHSVDPRETDLPGPNLAGIIGRKIAAQEGFEYSPALHALAEREGVWSEDLLDRFVTAPEEVAPKTSMTFHGLDDPAARADLLAYLRSSTASAR